MNINRKIKHHDIHITCAQKEKFKEKVLKINTFLSDMIPTKRLTHKSQVLHDVLTYNTAIRLLFVTEI